MTSRFYAPFVKVTSDTLKTLPGAKAYFYKNGTTTLQTTYQDVTLSTPHTNPVIADSAGNFPAIFLSGTYTVKITDTAGVVLGGYPVNNVGGETVTGLFDSWSAINTYQAGALVTGSDGLRYVAVSNSNLNNDPTTTTGYWAKVFFTQEWMAATTYAQYQTVYSAGLVYVSTQGTNLNNTPSTSPNFWQRVNSIPVWGNATAYKVNDYVVDSTGALQKCLVNNTNNNPTTPSVNWQQIKEAYVWNSTLTYASGAEVWVGVNRYISQAGANTNHNPVGDSGAWWRPDWQSIAAITQAIILTGGGSLTAFSLHIVTDGSTYTLPLANSVPANSVLQVLKPDQYRTSQPIIQCAGADALVWNGANDTSIKYDYGYLTGLVFKSNGSNQWSL